MYIDNDDIHTKALTNCVPAVAVIRKRQVFFILNRFKGYVNGNKEVFQEILFTRVICEECST